MDSIPAPLQYPDRSLSRIERVLSQSETYDDNEVDDERNQRETYTASRSVSIRDNDGTHEIWTKTARPRGRKARDANAQFVQFQCKDIDDLETSLRGYLAAPTAPEEHATIEFHFPATSAFLVYTRDFKRDSSTNWTSADVTDLMRRTAVSVVEVLQPTQNAKDQIVRQKAVARTIVEAIQRVDKFRYSFNNNWLSKEDRAHRFSFFCNDSTLNKGRAANGGAGTEGREHRKPVYECKGFIAVKFSVTKNNLEVHYMHIPLHKTYEERAPLPRRESKRRRMMEMLDPEGLAALRDAKRRKLMEARIGTGCIPTKTGRLARPELVNDEEETQTSTWRPANKTSRMKDTRQQPVADEALQPLLEFLGSAERVTPNNHRQDTEVQADGGNGGDSGDNDVTFLSASFEPASNAPKETRRRGRPPKNGVSAVRPTSARDSGAGDKNDRPRSTNSSGRSKAANSLLPGMMEGSIQSGGMDWTVTTPTRPDVEQTTTRDNGDKSRSNQAKKKQKEASGKAGEEAETEIQLLKRRLYETEQRLLKIEAEKSASGASFAPPYPYPPPLYPQYPYYPYPPPPIHYTTPTTGMPPPQIPQTAIPPANADNPPARGDTLQGQDPACTHSGSQAQPNEPTTNPNSVQPSAPMTEQAPIPLSAQGAPASSVNTASRPQAPGCSLPHIEANSHVIPVLTSVHPPWPAGVPLPEPPPPGSPQQQLGVRSLECDKHSRHAEVDANLKGLFDSAMAAITRPDPPTPAGRQSLTLQTSTDKDGGSRVDSAAESGSKSTKTRFAAFVPPRGVVNFQLADYQTPQSNTPTSAKTSKRSMTSDKDVSLSATGSNRPAIPLAAQGALPSISHAQPPYPYPYPYPPYQYPYLPAPHGAHPPPPPPGHPPYSVQGYPPYSQPPGYGYPACQPYTYPAAAPPNAPETEAQKKIREQKKKDIATNTPSWASQLRDAMTGYASSVAATPAPAPAPATAAVVSTPAPASVSTTKDKEKESAHATSTVERPKEVGEPSSGDSGPEVVEVENDGS